MSGRAVVGGKFCGPCTVGQYVTAAASDSLTVYWRPGCPFCSGLFRQLERAGVAYTAVDIWSDPSAAATVRSLAAGNETVPTVVVGDATTDGISLVNPDLDQIMAAAAEVAPSLIPDDYDAPQPGRVTRWVRARLGGA